MKIKALPVSVVVATYRRPELLKRCLECLAHQDIDENYEIIVADDGPDTATEAVVRRFQRENRPPSIRYLPVTETQGPAAARNAAWRVAEGRMIAFTDDDTLPDRSWLREGMKELRRLNAEAGRGKVLVPLRDDPTDYEKTVAGLATAEFVTANCFCSKAALKTVGGFDERFKTAWREDSDLHFNLLSRGIQIIPLPMAIVQHPVRPASWGISIRQQRNNLYEALLFRKHPQLYRHKVGFPPYGYYVITLSALAGLGLAIAGQAFTASLCFAVWAWMTGGFLRHRLQGTSRRLSHLLEMVVTSLAIPPVAVGWRLLGAWRFRTFFG